MTSDEKYIMEILSKGPLGLTRLCIAATMSEGRVYHTLRDLETAGLVRRIQGGGWETSRKTPLDDTRLPG